MRKRSGFAWPSLPSARVWVNQGVRRMFPCVRARIRASGGFSSSQVPNFTIFFSASFRNKTGEVDLPLYVCASGWARHVRVHDVSPCAVHASRGFRVLNFTLFAFLPFSGTKLGKPNEHKPLFVSASVCVDHGMGVCTSTRHVRAYVCARGGGGRVFSSTCLKQKRYQCEPHFAAKIQNR